MEPSEKAGAKTEEAEGNCPSGYYFAGFGWWTNAQNNWYSATKHAGSGYGSYNVYTCASMCGWGCVGFTLWNFQDCWTYSSIVAPLVSSSQSLACTKYGYLLQAEEGTVKSESVTADIKESVLEVHEVAMQS